MESNFKESNSINRSHGVTSLKIGWSGKYLGLLFDE